MISVCCCSINSKFETETFIRALVHHNPDVDFEIVLCHDDRVFDGSAEYFASFQQEIPNLKIIRNTHEDVVGYLRKLWEFYRQENYFPIDFLIKLKENIDKFEVFELFDHYKQFLWISSGFLYNKAIRASSGDILIVTPADFIYFFSLSEIENYVKKNTNAGIFYSKPHALFAHCSNKDREKLSLLLEDESRAFSNINLNYLRYPPKLSETYIVDIQDKELVSLAQKDFFKRMDIITQRYYTKTQNAPPLFLKHFHGFHTMTRDAYNKIGGFTEEFFGRAFADDKMSALGTNLFHSHRLPSFATVGWTRCASVQNFPEHGSKDILKQIDPYWNTHPISGLCGPPCYLEQGIVSSQEMTSSFKNKYLMPRLLSAPIKIV